MATLQENNVFLKFDSTEVQAFFKEATITPGVNEIDITHGAGTDHEQVGAGLKTTQLTATITYDIGSIQTYIQKIAPGAIVTVEYGPEGASSGKPRHVQSFLITGAPHTVGVDKREVTFSITGRGADAPSVDMYAGGTYS